MGCLINAFVWRGTGSMGDGILSCSWELAMVISSESICLMTALVNFIRREWKILSYKFCIEGLYLDVYCFRITSSELITNFRMLTTDPETLCASHYAKELSCIWLGKLFISKGAQLRAKWGWNPVVRRQETETWHFTYFWPWNDECNHILLVIMNVCHYIQVFHGILSQALIIYFPQLLWEAIIALISQVTKLRLREFKTFVCRFAT